MDIGIKNVQSFGSIHQDNYITVNNSNTDTIPASKVQVPVHEAVLNKQSTKYKPKAGTCRQQMIPWKNETHSYTETRKQAIMNDTAILKSLHDTDYIKQNIKKFHSSMEMSITQCSICKEAWPMANCKQNQNSNYVCGRCERDKGSPKKNPVMKIT